MEVRLTLMLERQHDSCPKLHLIPASDRRIRSCENMFSSHFKSRPLLFFLQNLANQISFLLVVNVCQPFEEKQPCLPLEPAGL